jgi:hypothetical protein
VAAIPRDPNLTQKVSVAIPGEHRLASFPWSAVIGQLRYSQPGGRFPLDEQGFGAIHANGVNTGRKVLPGRTLKGERHVYLGYKSGVLRM